MKIAFVVLPHMLATSLSNAYELWFAARQVARSLSARHRQTDIHLHKVALDDTRVYLPSGLSLQADTGLGKQKYDLIYLPALWRNPRPVVNRLPEIGTWLQDQYAQGTIINSTGTGVWFPASAGLLDNKPATTHWYFFDQFAIDFPQVQLKRQHFITSTRQIYCAASINALTDLTLHHVHRYMGKAVADHLSLHFSHEVRQPFDKLSFNDQENSNHPDELILQIQLWLQNHLSQTGLSIAKLANYFDLSQRSLNRRFKQATNLTPMAYLHKKRLTAARQLLRETNLSIKEIAYRVGYLDVSYFIKLFRQHMNHSPKEYRATLRAKLYSSR